MKAAVRSSVPLLVGISSPSGGGKTYSALRLATGMQSVLGGEIAMLDTEKRRGLHYADLFKFKHVDFEAPFGSQDYLAGIQHCHAAGAKIIIVDSLSHEHDGIGGLLESHEAELDRLAGSDYKKREAMKFLAWQKPKAARRALINAIVQTDVHFVFTFRAKKTIKPIKRDGKTEFEEQGFMPICGDEFPFECTVNILLPPASDGVPEWISEYAGEKLMMKLPMQFRDLFTERKQLDESIGKALAAWAQGGEVPEPSQPSEDKPPGPTINEYLEQIKQAFRDNDLSGRSAEETKERNAILRDFFGTAKWSEFKKMDQVALAEGLEKMREHFDRPEMGDGAEMF
jgi:hypothetical protein